MSEFSLEEFRKYNYKGARASIRFSTVLTGFFTEREKLSSGFTSFSIFFSLAAGGKLRKNPEFKDEIIESLEITEDGKRYLVKICLESEEIPEIQFFAVINKLCLCRYDGFSYENAYERFADDFKNFEAFAAGADPVEEERKTLADDLELVRKEYMKDNVPFSVYSVLMNNEEIFSHVCLDDQVDLKNPLIEHSNGLRYVAIKVHLYGISFFDPDTKECYHYMPEGYAHDYRYPVGESFIITAVHYNRKEDLVAYEGCYWACPCDVLIGDLKDPLNYDPPLLRTYVKYFEPLDDEAVKAKWRGNKLIIKGDDNTVELSVSDIRRELENGEQEQ